MKQDLLEGCISDVSGQGKRDYKAFQETFCIRCRNPECVHAKWADDKFSARVSTQFDRIFNPIQISGKHPRYAQIEDFKDIIREAIILESADRKGDWTIPEDPLQKPAPAPEPEVELPPIEDEGFEPEPVEPESIPVPAPPPKPTVVSPVMPKLGNTQAREGIMIGGATPTPRPNANLVIDPWAPAVKVVQPGTVIQMGEEKPND